MRFVFKTSYGQDVTLFRDGVQRNTYIALFLALLVLPLVVPEYVGDISLVFIYSLCGVSLMVMRRRPWSRTTSGVAPPAFLLAMSRLASEPTA